MKALNCQRIWCCPLREYSKRTNHWNIPGFVRFFMSKGRLKAFFFTFYPITGHLSAFLSGLSAFLRFSTDKMLIFMPACPYPHVRLNDDCHGNRAASIIDRNMTEPAASIMFYIHLTKTRFWT